MPNLENDPHQIALIYWIKRTLLKKNPMPNEVHLLALSVCLEQLQDSSTWPTSLRDFTALIRTRSKVAGFSDNQFAKLQIEGFENSLRKLNKAFQDEGPDMLIRLIKEVSSWMVQARDEKHNYPSKASLADKTSPLSLFLRRIILSFANIMFDQLVLVTEAFDAYCEGSDPLITSHYGIAFDAASKFLDPIALRSSAFQEQREASKRGLEYHEGAMFASRFFDYRFIRRIRRKNHQQALINAAVFHFTVEEYDRARELIKEAVKMARMTGDSENLSVCASLTERINLEAGAQPDILTADFDSLAPEHTTQKLPANKTKVVEREAAPLASIDQLWLAKRDQRQGAPITSCFSSLYKAKTFSRTEELPEETIPTGHTTAQGKPQLMLRRAKRHTYDEPTYRTIMADLWQCLDCETISLIHQDAGLEALRDEEVNETGGQLLSLTIQKAEKLTQDGQYDAALAILLELGEPLEDARLSLRDVARWQEAIAGVFGVQAERCDYEYLGRRIQNLAPTAEKTVTTDAKSEIIALIKKAEKFQEIRQHSSALTTILKALALSSIAHGKAYVKLHYRALILLVELHREFGVPSKGIEVIEEVWPQILCSDEEIQGRACYAKAKCLASLATAEGLDEQTLLESLQFLLEAESHFAAVPIPRQRLKVLKDLAQMYHSLGKQDERDKHAETWQKVTEELRDGKAEKELIDLFCRIEEFTVHVCSCIAAA